MKKAIVSSTVLLTALEEVKLGVPMKQVLPILEDGFLIEVIGDKMVITVNNDLQFIKTATISCLGKGDFSLAVGGLNKIIKMLKITSEQPLILEPDATNRLCISADDGSFRFDGDHSRDWPKPFHAEAKRYTQSTQVYTEFLEHIKGLQKFISTDELREAMTGIYYDSSSDRFVATNGHFLKWTKVGLQFENDFIMRNPFKYLPKAKMKDEPVTIKSYEGEMFTALCYRRLDTVDVELTIRNVWDARFPDYKDVVPEDFAREFSVGREIFLKAVKKATLVANDVTHQIRFKLGTQCGYTIESNDLDFNTGAKIDVGQGEYSYVQKEGEDVDVFEIGMNGKFAEEVLNTLDSDEVVIKMNKPNQAIIFNELHVVDACNDK